MPDDPEMEYIVHALSNNIPMSNEKKLIFAQELDKDQVLNQVKTFCQTEWPKTRKQVQGEVRHYYKLREDIYLSNNLLFLGDRVIVPKSLRQGMLNLIHESHFGIVKTKLRARQVLYWPHMSQEVEDLVRNCSVCQKFQKINQKEPMINYQIPARPWQYLHADFLEYDSRNYIAIVDSYSNWIEVAQTPYKTIDEVIKFLKNIFARFGVPDIFYADNVPFNSHKLKDFAKSWNFEIEFSSPHHHQSNGLAEKSVDIIKQMLRKNGENLEGSLMEYRNTPLPALGHSPAQLLLNRNMKTKLPASLKHLQNRTISPMKLENKLKEKQERQKFYYDQHSKELDRLQIGDQVLIRKGKIWVHGFVKDKYNDRSYIVQDRNGRILRRNRIYLKRRVVKSRVINNNYGHQDINRNVNQPIDDFDYIDNNTNRSDDNIHDNENTEVLANDENQEENVNGRVSSRIRRPPRYLQDYVTEATEDYDSI